MLRWVLFSLGLALVCGIAHAGIRDWLDRADDLARGLENVVTFPSRIVYTILGTRRIAVSPRKRITAEAADNSDLITIIRSPHSPLEMSNLRYLDEPGSVNGVQITPLSALAGQLSNRLSNRLDRVQVGISNRLGGVADKVTDRVSKTLDKATNGLGERVANGISDRLDGLTDRLTAGRRPSNILGNLLGGDKQRNDPGPIEGRTNRVQNNNNPREAGNQQSENKPNQAPDQPKGGPPNNMNGGEKPAEPEENNESPVGNLISGITDSFSGITGALGRLTGFG